MNAQRGLEFIFGTSLFNWSVYGLFFFKNGEHNRNFFIMRNVRLLRDYPE